jgi:hypothetical protein
MDWEDLKVGQLVDFTHHNRSQRLAHRTPQVKRGRIERIWYPADQEKNKQLPQIHLTVLNKDGTRRAGVAGSHTLFHAYAAESVVRIIEQPPEGEDVARPDKQERARRQQLASDRREREHLDAEEREQVLAAEAELRDRDRSVREDQARDADAYATAAVKALDRVAELVAACHRDGDDAPLEDLREILRAAGHPEFVPDGGWCGTGL